MRPPFDALSPYYPSSDGLYESSSEKDACGLAMVATTQGKASHDIIGWALEALGNLEHRGAVDLEDGTGDGAGILTQIPDHFFRQVYSDMLPPAGFYAVGQVFLQGDDQQVAQLKLDVEHEAQHCALEVIGWRQVPCCAGALGQIAQETMPVIEQLFVKDIAQDAQGRGLYGVALDRKTFALKRRLQQANRIYFSSFSSRTLVYKGMVTAVQLEHFYPDLQDLRFSSQLAIVHSRYSTNTFPSWSLAQPLRMVAHNGEINTIRANRNWMKARQSQLYSEVLGDLSEFSPILTPGLSDSGSFDEVVELLYLSGRSVEHVMSMMVPPAWENQHYLDKKIRAFYEYHSMFMEPWDGPATFVFTDGVTVGATLDRNGLRPGRYVITHDGIVILASEAGVLDLDPVAIKHKGRLQPGRMVLVDTQAGSVVDDKEVIEKLALEHPYGQWLEENRIYLRDLPQREHIVHTPASVNRRQRVFGYTEEELRLFLAPMAQTGQEPIGSMGTDTTIAAIANRPRLLFDYFSQQFAQVTNPPLDSIREEVVTSLQSAIGPMRNLLEATPEHVHQVVVEFPVIDNDELAKIQHIGVGRTLILRGLYSVQDGHIALANRIKEMCREADEAIERGAEFIVLSDRDSNHDLAPIPSLLMVSAIHHHLMRSGTRMKVGLIVEAGDVRQVHHVALLIGYGASAVNPYLAMETCEDLLRQGYIQNCTAQEAVKNVIMALGKGLLKIMSKMGISAVSSYSGAQTFEIVGLDQECVDTYFTGTTAHLGGGNLELIAYENEQRHRQAYPQEPAIAAHRVLEIGGEYQWRREGIDHAYNPDTIFLLQQATQHGRYEVFQQYTNLVDGQSRSQMTIRGMLAFQKPVNGTIPLEEVEPVSEIVKRFTTGAMSYGSLSQEVHEMLAVAMNSIGAKSNSGEGGEDLDRLIDPSRRSAIKQVASGRFGVTSMYLTHATDIQIKLSQGAKPGEGGQLPGQKVPPWIAKTRHATAGVGLVSPPPHHDIYSIEDLKQLIFDLKRANPQARIHVKLVSESGIGPVATGAVKALADVVLVSGHDGGTGAAGLNSLKHAGTPWELGLAETQQTLRINRMRDRVVLQADGQLKTGRDVIVAALLGADEFGFGTSALVASGCVMMRVCHLDTCPVGIATQDPKLREHFSGKPEYIVNFFMFLAQQVREHLASLGLRSLDEAIGRTDLLTHDVSKLDAKSSKLNLQELLENRFIDPLSARKNTRHQNHNIDGHFDNRLIALARGSLESAQPSNMSLFIRNTDRAVGTLLGHYVTKTYGQEGLPESTLVVNLRGSAGQSLGAFLPSGITLSLEGEANDYVAKGLSGGIVAIRPPSQAGFEARKNVIAGNVIGYGATGGKIFLNGTAGQRFLVRNSGAVAVVEGVGDHALEYMSGGVAFILGATGQNVGAGMLGGVAYLYRADVRKINLNASVSQQIRVGPLDQDDKICVRKLLVEHVQYTGSPLGKELLDMGDELFEHILKVIPVRYEYVQLLRKQARESGKDPDGPEVWEKIVEAKYG